MNNWLGPFKTADDAIDALRRSVAEIIEADPNTWPDHKNAPLAISAVVGLRAGAIKQLRKERDALRAELDALKRQEPYAFAVNFPESSRVELVHDLDEAYEDMIYEAYEVRKLYLAPGAQPAPSVPDGFSREDLEAVADGLDGYEKTVNVGNVTGEGDDHLESTTAYAARFIRTMLAATPETKP